MVCDYLIRKVLKPRSQARYPVKHAGGGADTVIFVGICSVRCPNLQPPITLEVMVEAAAGISASTSVSLAGLRTRIQMLVQSMSSFRCSQQSGSEHDLVLRLQTTRTYPTSVRSCDGTNASFPVIGRNCSTM